MNNINRKLDKANKDKAKRKEIKKNNIKVDCLRNRKRA